MESARQIFGNRGVALAIGITAVTCGICGCLFGYVVGNTPKDERVTREITVEVTTISEVIVTVTGTDTPPYTATITDTPTITLTPTITFTPSITPTPTRTPTATVTPSPTKFQDLYAEIDVRELDKNPDKYLFQRFVLNGEIFNIEENSTGTYFQMWVGTDRIPVVVSYSDDLPGVFEGTLVRVYGTMVGTVTGTNAFGGEVTQPQIDADVVEIR